MINAKYFASDVAGCLIKFNQNMRVTNIGTSKQDAPPNDIRRPHLRLVLSEGR